MVRASGTNSDISSPPIGFKVLRYLFEQNLTVTFSSQIMSFSPATSRRVFSSLLRRYRHFSSSAPRCQSSIAHIPSCPSPTCLCAPMPRDLDIDRKTPLLHTMAPYSEQVVICTGKDDWTSRVEDEESDAGDFVRGIKGVIGRGGKAFDVCQRCSHFDYRVTFLFTILESRTCTPPIRT